MRVLGIVLFPGFELLDVYGPVEMFGMYPDEFELRTVAESKGLVPSGMGPATAIDDTFADGRDYDLLLVPGGPGTRTEVDNNVLIDWLRAVSDRAELITTVCTGSAVLARTGLLDGRRATTNKNAFAWVEGMGPNVMQFGEDMVVAV